ncbi:CDP-glycerol glycerophosphotransferase family protein [Legionella sp. W05-934-2]|jgi:CDP-glycerol glycerophosphotransferase|uniref:CDP-glycerol glycerophosphotransferase family protein n=1 Tax=Legionella sp. W05-934-2 TaxID=1198649 RepID=UPI003461C689
MNSLIEKYKENRIDRIKKLYTKKKLQPHIVIDSFKGNKLDSNCIKIANHLANKHQVIFATNQHEHCWCIDPRIKIVEFGSVRHVKYLHSAKVIINNVRYNKLLNKHPHQTYIQIWHGIPYKKLAFDQTDISSAWIKTNKYLYLAGFLNEINKWDYLFAQNQYTADRFRSCFLYDKKLIQANYPCDLPSTQTSQDKILQLKKNLNIPLDKKIILYTPTFREYAWDNDKGFLLSGLLPEAFFQKHPDYVFLVRAHYMINEKFNFGSLSNMIDMTNYPFIEDLYQVSDLLITDYSSILFEFARFQKPIISYQSDYEEYAQKRGLYDVSLTDMGITVYTDWNEIRLDFTRNSFLNDRFGLVRENLIDEIDKIIAEKMDLEGNRS